MNSNENLLPLVTAIEQATGQRVHPSTAHRWRLRGIAGIKLTTVRCGGRRMCRISDVKDFLEGVTSATDGERPTPPTRTRRRREHDIDRVKRELDQQGF